MPFNIAIPTSFSILSNCFLCLFLFFSMAKLPEIGEFITILSACSFYSGFNCAYVLLCNYRDNAGHVWLEKSICPGSIVYILWKEILEININRKPFQQRFFVYVCVV